MKQLTFDEFSEVLRCELILGLADMLPNTNLADDLNLDSLGMFELAMILEENGAIVDEDTVLLCDTLGEVYSVYVTALSNASR